METITAGYRQQRQCSVYPIPYRRRPHTLADPSRGSPHLPAERLKMSMQYHRDLARLCRRQEAVVGSSTCPSWTSHWVERLIEVATLWIAAVLWEEGKSNIRLSIAGGHCWTRQQLVQSIVQRWDDSGQRTRIYSGCTAGVFLGAKIYISLWIECGVLLPRWYTGLATLNHYFSMGCRTTISLHISRKTSTRTSTPLLHTQKLSLAATSSKINVRLVEDVMRPDGRKTYRLLLSSHHRATSLGLG